MKLVEIAPWVSTKLLDIPSQMTPYLLMKQKGVIVQKIVKGHAPLQFTLENMFVAG